jgi:hypothetical protein
MTSCFNGDKFTKELPENILYSPNKNILKPWKASGITIWDNYTYYLRYKYNKKDKHEKARDHYLWLINYIKDNYIDGITLITPDVEWLKYRDEIEQQWHNNCKDYPQLYVPNTWKDISGINIVGHALRIDTPDSFVHKRWNHCLRHVRQNLKSSLNTYDASNSIEY